MISRTIAWCARNPFLVFTCALLLTAAGVWSLGRVPLDALPDISDVQVVVHTTWPGEPPDVVEDQVTYPIVTALLAAPHVKNVRAQTMFGDSCVFVIFDDRTDLYWARSRVSEYMQQLAGKLPAGVNPLIGPDATGAGWVYEYAVVDRSHAHSLADLRTLQDWFLRYQLETVPGVAEVATIGGFVRQYQVNLDPQKLFSYGIPASMVIDRVRQSTNEVGGDVLEAGGAEYMIRGLGYLRNVADLEDVPVATKNGTPVLVRDLGTVTLGPDVRRGAAEWQGEGETVGGIVVMRYGTNALNVIEGVKAKLKEIGPSLPPGVKIVTAYDRSSLINTSIHTLKRDLILEAIIVSFVSIFFLFHFRSALVPIITLPIAVLAAFIPMYYLQVSSNIMSLGGLALAIGVLVDAAIVMVENGYRHIAERNDAARLGGVERRRILVGAAQQVGPALFYSLIIIVVSFLPVFLLEAQVPHVPPAGLDEDAGAHFFLAALDHAGAGADAPLSARQTAARGEEPHGAREPGALPPRAALVPAPLENCGRAQSHLPRRHRSAGVSPRQPIHARALRGLLLIYAELAAGHFDYAGSFADAAAGPDYSIVSGSVDCLRHRGAVRQPNG